AGSAVAYLSFTPSGLVHQQAAGGVQLLNLLHQVGQIREDEIVMPFANPGRLQQERGAADDVGGLNVLPFVTDDVGALEVEVPFERRFRQQARLRFAAGTSVRLVVGTHQDVVQGQA